MTSREVDETIEIIARYQARYAREALELQPPAAEPDTTTAADMQRILDVLAAELPGGLKHGEIMAALGKEGDGRPMRRAWKQVKARRLITDATPFQITKLGEDWKPEGEPATMPGPKPTKQPKS